MAVQPADIAVDAGVTQAQAGHQPGDRQPFAAHDGDEVLFAVLAPRLQQRAPGIVAQATLAVAVGRIGGTAVTQVQSGKEGPARVERTEPGGIHRSQLTVVIAGQAALAIALALPVGLQLEQAARIQRILPFAVQPAAALQGPIAHALVVIARRDLQGMPCAAPAVAGLHAGIEFVVGTVPAPGLAERKPAHIDAMMTGQRPATFQVAVVVQAHRALGIGKIALDDAGLADAEQAGAAGRAAGDVVAPSRAGGQRSFPALARLQRGQVGVHPSAHTCGGGVVGIDATGDGREQRHGIAVALVFGIDTRQFKAGRQEIRLGRQQRLVFVGRAAVVAGYPRQAALRVVAQQRVVAGQYSAWPRSSTVRSTRRVWPSMVMVGRSDSACRRRCWSCCWWRSSLPC
ncbi:hypothetical protein G6F31_014423 [Rhizopus arrhizus]|nr:hypothetical protein G6F31_014423 [Rhizopus arrhizus]